MRSFQNLPYKIKVGLLLAILLGCLLLNNIINRKSFGNIEKAAISIYEDRLLPSTYIFEIREYLYKEKSPAQAGNKANMQVAHKYKADITRLLDKYEHTVLTKQEKNDLVSLKSNLHHYYSLPGSAVEKDKYFAQTLESLNSLLRIQSDEGNHLKTQMTSIVYNSTLLSYLEVALLIVIGVVTLSFIGFSKHAFQTIPQNSFLN